jgi:hypothetical protein
MILVHYLSARHKVIEMAHIKAGRMNGRTTVLAIMGVRSSSYASGYLIWDQLYPVIRLDGHTLNARSVSLANILTV